MRTLSEKQKEKDLYRILTAITEKHHNYKSRIF